VDAQEFQNLLARVRQHEPEALEEMVTWLRQQWSPLFKRCLLSAGVPERDMPHAVDEVFNEVRTYGPRFQGNHQGA
jgi:hypothetical protein